jgi:hypothetical protein
LTEIGYFSGVRVGLGDPEEFWGITSVGYRLKSVYLDVFDDYAFFWSSGSNMPLHNYMVDFILSRVGLCGLPWTARKGARLDDRRVPDVIINGYFFEVETGLKHSLKALNTRLKKYRNFCYVVVPNSLVKARYRRVLTTFHGRLLTMKEFDSTFFC